MALSGSPANASVKTWWTGFCERHIVADDPYQDMEHLWPMEKTDPTLYTTKIISIYRRIGSKVYWKTAHHVRLRALGNELRRLKAQYGDDERITHALEDYGRFE